MIFKVQLKSSSADQDIVIEYNQMRFIFQHSLLCAVHTSTISVAVLVSHWSKKVIKSRYDNTF